MKREWINFDEEQFWFAIKSKELTYISIILCLTNPIKTAT